MRCAVSGSWLRLIARSHDGNYPNWRAVVPDLGTIKTTIDIERGAAEEVIRTVARMPDHDSVNHSIGLEISGKHLSLLGRSPGSDKWTRIELAGVKVTGPDVTIHLNRQFLSKALRFGVSGASSTS